MRVTSASSPSSRTRLQATASESRRTRSSSRRPSLPNPSISYAIQPKTRQDEDRLSSAIARVLEEDQALNFYRDAQTQEFLLAGNGQQHLDVVCSKLQKRYNVNVELRAPKVPYRETIRGTADVHGRHKKQTGGHGQFGDCKIRVAPLDRGAEFEFVDEIFGGSIPKTYIPAVEKGIIEAAARGYLAGYPVVDFKVTLYDGSHHDVDSSELAFKAGGKQGVQAGDGGGAARAPGTDRESRGGRSHRVRWRPDGGPEQPARKDSGDGLKGLDAAHPRGRADGRDADLRERPHLHDAGQGLVLDAAGPLRLRAGPDRGEDHPDGQARAQRRRRILAGIGRQQLFGEPIEATDADDAPGAPLDLGCHCRTQNFFVAGVNRNSVFRNEGDGRFPDATPDAGLVGVDRLLISKSMRCRSFRWLGSQRPAGT